MADKISYRVMKVAEFGGKNPSIFYKLECACTDNDHIITFEMEHDHNSVILNMHQNIAWSSYYGSDNIFRRIKDRIVNSFKVLFFGYLEGEGTLILNGEDHIQSFIDALVEGKDYAKKYRENFEKEISDNQG